MQQKTDRPITQHVMPKCNGRSLNVFSQAIEAQKFRDCRGGKIIGLERDAGRRPDELRTHRAQNLEPRQSAIVLTVSTTVAPPQAREVQFSRDSDRRFPLARTKLDHPRQVEKNSAQSPAPDGHSSE